MAGGGFLGLLRSLMGIGPWTSRPGPLTGPAAPTDAGWIPLNWPLNFGQAGWDPIPGGWNSVVFACIMLYARTLAALPAMHKRRLANNGEEILGRSAATRVLRRPNGYQTRSDFIFNLVVNLLDEGNAYALAFRNDRFEVNELHLMRPRSCHAVVGEGGEVFYAVAGNQVVETMPEFWADPDRAIAGRFFVPARDVMHVRAWTPRHPLIGETPMVAAALTEMLQARGLGTMAAYFQNMSKPSGVLATDVLLTAEQVRELRARWEEQTKGAGVGGTPILTAGLKWQDTQSTFNAANSQVAELMKWSVADIARVFAVPLALINDMTGATYNNVEQLIMHWLRMGLGFYLEHLELNFDRLFELDKSDEFIELDIRALLRPDFKTQIEGLVRAVTGGVYSPNEARAEVALPKVEGGDEPRVQQQQVPLSWEAPAAAPAPAAPPPPKPEDDDADPEEDEDDPEKNVVSLANRRRAYARARLAALIGEGAAQ